MIAPVCGSVYILCTGDQVPTMTTCTVGDRTLIFEKVVEVEEIDNEDDSGNCIQLLCHPVNGIEVSSNIMTLASSYFKKTCSGTTQRGLPCRNRVRQTASRCRWHIPKSPTKTIK